MRAAAVTSARTVSRDRSCAGFFRGARFARGEAIGSLGHESTFERRVTIISRMESSVMSIRERARGTWTWLRGWRAAIALLRDPNDLEQVFVLDRAMPA